jgi:predicted ATPase
MAITRLKKITVRKFRALRDIEIDVATHLTVICGKNGTSKSSILGVAAQVFSFEKDYEKDEALAHQTITGKSFKSLPSDHFRFSDKFDIPGSLDAAIEVQDGYTGTDASADLELMKRATASGTKARPVVRNNSTVKKGNTSRNFTHPVIYLSLDRLQPIASRDYKPADFKYLTDNKKKFLALSNKLLNKTSTSATATSGTIHSAVAHSETYDQDSVSTGEDNVGQIVLALMSFRKLKEEYANYKGGLLLIDEADAGLFPAAQLALLDVLDRECSELSLQVIVTSHSPTLIERVYELSRLQQRKYKTIYLSDTFGSVQSMPDMSWASIYADLHTTTVVASPQVALPSVNVYFEDGEALDFFSALSLRQPFKRYIKPLAGVTLGCTNYVQLIKKGIPEFARRSVVVLDSDAAGVAANLKTVAILPGHLPPDQLLFEFLYNLGADDPIWTNSLGFTRPVFTSCAQDVIGELGLGAAPIDLEEIVDEYRDQDGAKKPREFFKRFYKTESFQRFLSTKGVGNPWTTWIKHNDAAVQEFRGEFIARVRNAMTVGFGVDPSKLAHLA